MKRLTDDTINTIVTALIFGHQELVESITFFEQRAERLAVEGKPTDSTLTGLQLTRKHFNDNSAALRELSTHVAPWLKKDPRLNSVFNQQPSKQTPTAQESP